METSLCSPPSGPLWPVMGQGKPAGAGEGGFPKVPESFPSTVWQAEAVGLVFYSSLLLFAPTVSRCHPHPACRLHAYQISFQK